jgi:hypothetical protein
LENKMSVDANRLFSGCVFCVMGLAPDADKNHQMNVFVYDKDDSCVVRPYTVKCQTEVE